MWIRRTDTPVPASYSSKPWRSVKNRIESFPSKSSGRGGQGGPEQNLKKERTWVNEEEPRVVKEGRFVYSMGRCQKPHQTHQPRTALVRGTIRVRVGTEEGCWACSVLGPFSLKGYQWEHGPKRQHEKDQWATASLGRPSAQCSKKPSRVREK